jgi:putative ABC transport system ATP-binding protein
MIAVRGLDFSYRTGGFHLHVPELDIARGESVALIGPSGCGKTTLLNLLSGILAPGSGQIQISDIDLAELSPEDRRDLRAVKMGLIFQEFELLDYLSVLDNILLPYRVSEILDLDNDVRRRAEELTREVGLGEKLRQFPEHLSQGERQRVAVCRALLSRPALMFGDEPTGNLDPENRDHIMDVLFSYAAESGSPLLAVTHDHELLHRFDRTLDIRDIGA